jgi:hypothetical protein
MWEWLRKLFGSGEGATQIGKGNQASTGSTSGHNSPVISAGRDVYVGAAPATGPSPTADMVPHLSDEARELLVAGSEDPRRTIEYDRWLGGVSIEANGKKFTVDNDPDGATAWENAIEELEDHNLIEPRDRDRSSFRVNANGARVAALMRGAKPSDS